jgi:hypothetical protein
MPSPTYLGPLGPLPLAGEYATPADIKAALQAHARDNGYAIAADSRTPTRAYWICFKGGKYNHKNKSYDMHPTKCRRNTRTTKTGGEFRVRTTYSNINNM